MTLEKDHVLDLIAAQGVLPLFYEHSLQASERVLEALYAGGTRVVEYTNRGDEALTNFKALAAACHARLPGLVLGAGTIKNLREAQDFLSAGAKFIVSPVTVPQVGNFLAREKILWIPGAMTPTEITAGRECGATLIKIFPAELLGPAFIRSVRTIFPDLRFVPTGGVDLDRENLETWFKAGVAAVGIGSKLITKDIVYSSDWNKLTYRTADLLKTIQMIKTEHNV